MKCLTFFVAFSFQELPMTSLNSFISWIEYLTRRLYVSILRYRWICKRQVWVVAIISHACCCCLSSPFTLLVNTVAWKEYHPYLWNFLLVESVNEILNFELMTFSGSVKHDCDTKSCLEELLLLLCKRFCCRKEVGKTNQLQDRQTLAPTFIFRKIQEGQWIPPALYVSLSK